MTALHWSHYHDVWPHLVPPLRPTQATADQMCALLPDRDGQTILLGVTPELANATRNLVAVDASAEMIRAIWPGDTASRWAICADWLDLPFKDHRFGAAVGDACHTVLTFPDQHQRLYASLTEALAPGARLIFRVHCRPDRGESIVELREEVAKRRIGGFQEFKWRLAMVLAAERPQGNLPVREILAAFNALFPDRRQLISHTGWVPEQVATIAGYAESSEVYSFPTRAQFLSVVPRRFAGSHFIETAGFPLAERSPLWVAEVER